MFCLPVCIIEGKYTQLVLLSVCHCNVLACLRWHTCPLVFTGSVEIRNDCFSSEKAGNTCIMVVSYLSCDIKIPWQERRSDTFSS